MIYILRRPQSFQRLSHFGIWQIKIPNQFWNDVWWWWLGWRNHNQNKEYQFTFSRFCIFWVCTARWIWDRIHIFYILSHHLTWHCSSISEDLHRFTRNLQHLLTKLFLLLFLWYNCSETIKKKQFCQKIPQISCKLVQIFRNTGTMPCQMMAQVSR